MAVLAGPTGGLGLIPTVGHNCVSGVENASLFANAPRKINNIKDMYREMSTI